MDIKEVQARYKRASHRKAQWLNIYNDAIKYTMPGRETMTSAHGTVGETKADDLFDSTAVQGLQEFANRIQSGLFPDQAKWMDFTVSTTAEMNADQRKQTDGILSMVRDIVFEGINKSNFAEACNESLQDLGIGTSCLIMQPGRYPGVAFEFTSVPISHVILEYSAGNELTAIFRPRKLTVEDIEREYPGAMLPASREIEDARKDLSKETFFDCYEAVINKSSRAGVEWCFYLVMEKQKHIAFEETMRGEGSCPFIVSRWSRASGEVYGRGPVINTLQDIKTLNLVQEFLLNSAELAIAGIFQYEDDGVINPDTIRLVSNELIPIAPGSAGLRPINTGIDLNLAQFKIQEMRANIKYALFNDALGAPEGTPMSATEVSERMQLLAERIGPSFGRVTKEMAVPIIKRAIWILAKLGKLEVDLSKIDFVLRSPLARAHRYGEARNLAGFVGEALQLGQQEALTIIDMGEALRKLGDLREIPHGVVRTKAQQQQMIQQMQQAMQAAQGAASGGIPQG